MGEGSHVVHQMEPFKDHDLIVANLACGLRLLSYSNSTTMEISYHHGRCHTWQWLVGRHAHQCEMLTWDGCRDALTQLHIVNEAMQYGLRVEAHELIVGPSNGTFMVVASYYGKFSYQTQNYSIVGLFMKN